MCRLNCRTADVRHDCAEPALAHARGTARARVIRFERRNLAACRRAGPQGRVSSDPLPQRLFIYLHAAGARDAGRARWPQGTAARRATDRRSRGSDRVKVSSTRLFAPVKPAASFAFVHGRAPIAVREPNMLREATGRKVVRYRTAAHSVPRPRSNRLRLHEKPRHVSGLTATIEFYRRALEHHEQGSDRKAERCCRQALYLAPGYLPALELLQILWRLHPNLRLRRALSARILRVRGDVEALLAAPDAARRRSAHDPGGSRHPVRPSAAAAGYREELQALVAAEPPKPARRTGSILLFQLGELRLALPARVAAAVAPVLHIAHIPHRSGTVLLGVVAFRGEILPCCSLARLLDVAQSQSGAARMLILEESPWTPVGCAHRRCARHSADAGPERTQRRGSRAAGLALAERQL